MPTVSVLLPVHNAMPYLPEAVGSILGQDMADLELIALDDASTDGGRAYLDALGDPRVRVFHLPKRGLTRNLNVGLREARGVYVARMDADDVSMPSRLGAQRRHLDENPGVVAVGCQALEIDGEGRPTGPWHFPTGDLEIKLDLFRDVTPMVHPGVMFRSQTVLDLGGYDESFATAQDRDLWWRLADRGRFANLADELLLYRRHTGSVTGRKAEEQRRLTREMTWRSLAGFGLIDGEEQYRAFREVDDILAIGFLRRLEPGPVGVYVEVLDRMLAFLVDRCGADLGAARRHRRDRWRKLMRWGLTCRGASDLPRWGPLLRRLAPGEHRPDRLLGWGLEVAWRRLLRAGRPGPADPATGS
ncbi:glycosyltransferase family 2 protein [Tautonia plasticadhaerens]|uniref:Glycosyltransferase EpsE n=1 Tax=Tautonia plasticadhaerens TaxID=2527974 RepID=A0A518H780_9BACT|nr:glycosyltransferase [Tautonia plasticadhaerens]QDV36641.1 Putative glycosyltransferase EpsE [Tautonia plasticadhaerens]